MTLYSCIDVRLRSAMVLSELRPAREDDLRQIVDIGLAVLPESLPGATAAGAGIQVAGDKVLLVVPGVARYLIQGGREITIDPYPDHSDRNLRLFLLGSALGILCHQRGLLPLHANAIVVDGAAVAFAGRSGAGKSTLAAHFQRKGYDVLCDDVCVLGVGQDGCPVAWPGLPRLKLWGDAVEALGHRRDQLDPAIEGMDKYHVPFAKEMAARPVPFRALYLLDKAGPFSSEIAPVRGQRAMEAMLTQTYRGQYRDIMGLTGRQFLQAASFLRHAQVFTAARAWGFDVFDVEVARLEEHMRGAVGTVHGTC